MKDSILEILMFSGIFSSICYLIGNIVLQIRAKKRLEIIMRLHRTILQEQFKKQNSDLSHSSKDSEYEILLMLLRQEIDTLKEATDKRVMKKTLDRKNFSNQKRYAFKLFSESGLADILGLQ